MTTWTPFEFLYSQFFVTIPAPTASFTGETVVITGSNGGIGKEAAKQFIGLGASKLILAVRSLSKGNAARDWILKTYPEKGDAIEVWELDMSSRASVMAFAKRLDSLDRIDYLIPNAGVNSQSQPYSLTEGDETAMAINVISTYLLVLAALPALRKSGKKTGKTPTVSITGSDTYYWAGFNAKNAPSVFKWYADKKNYDGNAFYMDSKLLLMLYMQELAPQIAASASTKGDVIMNLNTPGLCKSGLLGGDDAPWFVKVVLGVVARSSEVGGHTIVSSAKMGKQSHGQFILDGHVRAPSKYVASDEGQLKARMLWDELNEKLEGIAPGVTKNI